MNTLKLTGIGAACAGVLALGWLADTNLKTKIAMRSVGTLTAVSDASSANGSSLVLAYSGKGPIIGQSIPTDSGPRALISSTKGRWMVEGLPQSPIGTALMIELRRDKSQFVCETANRMNCFKVVDPQPWPKR